MDDSTIPEEIEDEQSTEENLEQDDDEEEWDEDEVDPVADLLFDILDLVGLEGEIEYEERDDHVRYHIEGEDMGLLIGKKGQTLEALQYLVGIINARKKLVDYRIIVDVEGYRDRREERLKDIAFSSADRANREGRKIVLNRMSGVDRRIVHMALADRMDVRTYSEGEEPDRCVVIAPGFEEE